MNIRCGNCSGTHGSIAEVRNCHDGDSTGTLHVDLDEEDRAERFFCSDSYRQPASVATDKQVNFLQGLLASRDIPQHMEGQLIHIRKLLPDPEEKRPCLLGKRDASVAIQALIKLPSLPKEKLAASARDRRSDQSIDSDGMFRDPVSGRIFKVQYALHGSGRLYAKLMVLRRYIEGSSGDFTLQEIQEIPLGQDPVRFDDGSKWEVKFVYSPGAIWNILPEWRMSKEEAGKFGALYGTCIKCGLQLTKEESIDRGMGDACASKEGYWA